MALRYFISRAPSTTRYVYRNRVIRTLPLSTVVSNPMNTNHINQQEWDAVCRDYCNTRISTISKNWTAAMTQLPNNSKNNNLRDCAVIHLLLGRCLDTIEDDASLNSQQRIKLLAAFCELLEFENNKIDTIEKAIEINNMFTDIGSKDEDIELLQNLSKILHFFYTIKNVEMKNIIKTEINNMSNGMSIFLAMEGPKSCINDIDNYDTLLDDKFKTFQDYEKYIAHVVKPIADVHHKIFMNSGPGMGEEEKYYKQISDSELNSLIISVCTYLQTIDNIIDFADDFEEGRCVFVKEILSKYNVPNVYYLKSNPNKKESLYVLNNMVLFAMRFLEGSMKYISLFQTSEFIQYWSVFHTISTMRLTEAYNNPDVFINGVEIKNQNKILKQMVNNNIGFNEVINMHQYTLNEMNAKLDESDPNAEQIANIIESFGKQYNIN